MASPAGWSYTTTLPADARSAAMARSFVCKHLMDHALPHLVDDVVLAASELATNAISHAQTSFVVTLSSAEGLLELVLSDESPLPPIPEDPQLFDEKGRGLMIVEHLSYRWGTRTDPQGAKSVWASFLERVE